MALPTRLRYWLVRLKAWNRPALWCSGLAVVMLAVVLQQYRTHPEWLGRFEVDGDAPGQPPAGSALSTDEQAQIADIDTLDNLYGDLAGGPILPETAPTQAAASEPPQSLLAALQAPAPAAAADPAAANSSPFAAYLEQYRFLGGGLANGAAPLAGAAAQPAQLRSLPGPLLPASPTSVAPAASLSPLQQAIAQQTNGAQPLQNSDSAALAEVTGLSDRAPTPGISPATLPGTNQTFLRTTPQMSPLPGTTGYVPPLTLTLPSAPALPSPAAVSPNLSPVSPSLNLPAAGAAGAAGATVLPPATGGGYDQPSSQINPAASGVPRPPGSYAGNGFIYTFSDPNGPAR
jgi:hypothetical protein